jgi:hypothetical protein
MDTLHKCIALHGSGHLKKVLKNTKAPRLNKNLEKVLKNTWAPGINVILEKVRNLHGRQVAKLRPSRYPRILYEMTNHLL